MGSCADTRGLGGALRVTPRADRGYDTRGFATALRDLGVTPHVARA